MALSSTSTTFATTTASYPRPPLPPLPASAARSLRRPSTAASTPNLNLAYASAQTTATRLPPAALLRKASLATLTPSSLASIPDASESYALNSVLSDNNRNMAPATPGRLAAADVAVGDVVDVPGNMQGTVRFVGSVQGKNGTFAGVELDQDFSARGKNNGDVDG